MGAILGPFDCWLALRGLKTMALRMERQAANCAALAWFLAAHPLVQRVNYAGLPSHPGAQLHARQATSGGSLLSFTTGECVSFAALLPICPQWPQCGLPLLLLPVCR